MATLYAKSGGGNWSAAGTWSNVNAAGVDNSGPPGAGDDVIFELASGNVTIDAAASCRSLDTTSGTGTYGGVLTHNSGVTLTIGDATAGAGNVALKLNSGMTYTKNNPTASQISFNSTSTTQQTVTFATLSTGNLIFGGGASGANYQLQDNLTATAISITHTRGTLDINGKTLSISSVIGNNGNTRTLTLGAASITCANAGNAWNFVTTSGLTVTANTATLTITGAAAFFRGGTNWNGLSIVFNTGGAQSITDASATFANMTITGIASKTDFFQLPTGTTTITSSLTTSGNSITNRLLIRSATTGTASTLALSGASVTDSNTDFTDTTFTGSPSQTPTSVGDAQGNTGITFTTPVTRYAVVAGNWSSTATWSSTSGGGGGSSVPLGHDTVIMDSSSAAGTYTADMPRMSADLNMSGFTRTISLGINGGNLHLGNTMYGNLTGATGGTFTPGNANFFLAGRGAQTITTNTQNISSGNNRIISISAPGGSYTLQDDWTSNNSNTTIQLDFGTFDANNKNINFNLFASSNTNTRTLTMGSGTWTSNNNGATTFWNIGTATNLTLSGSSSTIVLSATSTSTRTFAGGGKTYGTLTYTVAGSTGQLSVTGSNTFNTLNFSDVTNARTLAFTAATTNTFTTFNVNGTSGKLMTIGSITAAGHTLSKSSGNVVADYTSISRSTATGGAGWYAPDSTDGGNNSGWIFNTFPVVKSDSATITESVSVSIQSGGVSDLTITVNDTATTSESVSLLETSFISISDTATLSEALTLSLASTINVSDTATATEAVTLLQTSFIAASDSATITESVALLIPSLFINVSDTITITESIVRLLISFVNVTDTASTSESINIATDLTISVSDTVTLSESLKLLSISFVNVNDTATGTESVSLLIPILFVNVSDSSSLSENVNVSTVVSGPTLSIDIELFNPAYFINGVKIVGP